MMPIDKAVYAENLRLTQRYCSLQLNEFQGEAKAMALRSFNPVYGSRQLFQYKMIGLTTKYQSADWEFMTYFENTELFSQLYQQQLEHKRQRLVNRPLDENFAGRILVARIDETVLDGASEEASEGFIDLFDMPPIDSWFYLENDSQFPHWRILYAWIPEQFVETTQIAIDVNCVECFNWIEEVSSTNMHSNVIKSQNLFHRFGSFIKSRILGFKQF